MRALSLSQPWAHAIVHFGKTVENRVWKRTWPQGNILLHASAGGSSKYIENAFAWMREHGVVTQAQVDAVDTLPIGGIIGAFRIVGCIPSQKPGVASASFGFGEHPHATNPWWMREQYGYVLTDVRPLPFVPCRGMLGFWTVPDDVVETLRALAPGSLP